MLSHIVAPAENSAETGKSSADDVSSTADSADATISDASDDPLDSIGRVYRNYCTKESPFVPDEYMTDEEFFKTTVLPQFAPVLQEMRDAENLAQKEHDESGGFYAAMENDERAEAYSYIADLFTPSEQAGGSSASSSSPPSSTCEAGVFSDEKIWEPVFAGHADPGTGAEIENVCPNTSYFRGCIDHFLVNRQTPKDLCFSLEVTAREIVPMFNNFFDENADLIFF